MGSQLKYARSLLLYFTSHETKINNNGINFLTNTINGYLQLCYLPRVWKSSKIIAILKLNEPRNCLSSYRPISLLEKIIKDKPSSITIRSFLRNASIFVILLNQTLLLEWFSTRMIVLHANVAFDSVYHGRLVFRMLRHNFHPEFVKITQNLLKDRDSHSIALSARILSITHTIWYIHCSCSTAKWRCVFHFCWQRCDS